MRVLSLFDGISGAKQALAGIPDVEYYASEIDKYAIKVSKKNHPDIIHLGDVNELDFKALGKFDLLIGGSPCQGLSIAKKDRQGLKDSRSALFYKFLEARDVIQPTYFLLENVASMSVENKEEITKCMGVEPVKVNSKMFVPQSRKRFYWYNWTQIGHMMEPYVSLSTIVEDGWVDRPISHCLDANYHKGATPDHYWERSVRQLVFKTGEYFRATGKRVTRNIPYRDYNGVEYRLLTPVECERLQGYPDNYTHGISNTQRYKSLGNSFTVPVIQSRLRGIL